MISYEGSGILTGVLTFMLTVVVMTFMLRDTPRSLTPIQECAAACGPKRFSKYDGSMSGTGCHCTNSIITDAGVNQ